MCLGRGSLIQRWLGVEPGSRMLKKAFKHLWHWPFQGSRDCRKRIVTMVKVDNFEFYHYPTPPRKKKKKKFQSFDDHLMEKNPFQSY